jgi:hypothetical protein
MAAATRIRTTWYAGRIKGEKPADLPMSPKTAGPRQAARSSRDLPQELSSASNVKFRPKSLLKPRPPDGPKYFPSP